MRTWLHRLDPGRPLGRVLFFRAAYWVCWVVVTVVYRLRVLHRERAPPEGALLVVANHQSHLDPLAVGGGLTGRHFVAIARLGLFKSRALAWLLRSLSAIPIHEREGDAAAVRRALAELAQGRCVLIFPEGTRSHDGSVQPFKRGAWVLISRAKCAVLPVGVDGAFDAWPRGRGLPRAWGCRIAASFGEPIVYEELAALGHEGALEMLRTRVAALQMEARGLLRTATDGRYPAPGPADGAAAGGTGTAS